jgi:hypothetical protein
VPRLISIEGVSRRGDIIGGGDLELELLPCVDKGGRHTELTHVLEHDTVVNGV